MSRVAQIPAGAEPQALYVASRRVLLDALDALEAQRQALCLVGAHAVYLRSISVDLRIAAMTSDGDLGLDPTLVATTPLLEAALSQAGFTATSLAANRSRELGGAPRR
jgi:hypothetical protein